MKSLRNSSGDNIALLLKQVDVIARFYQDRIIAIEAPPSSTSASSSAAVTSSKKRKTNRDKEKEKGKGVEEQRAQYDRLHVVTQVAQHVLTGLIKTQDNVQPYLGTYMLPVPFRSTACH